MTNTTTVTLNEATVELVTAFVKENEVSNAKITDLVQQVLILNGVSAHRGRTASETIIHLRAKIKENAQTIDKNTSNEVADRFGVSINEANSVLNFLEKSGVVTRVGLKERGEGSRGRRQVLWSFAQQ